jgi:Txe/YoeB family toxin of Txe-Axe toxin-antitoxin module
MEPRPAQEPDLGGVWLDVVAAVDHLSRHHRLGLTIWEAVEEALRWWTADLVAPEWGDLGPDGWADTAWVDDPDPLRTTIERLLATVEPSAWAGGPALERSLTGALEQWIRRMAEQYNDGRHWPHPAPRRGWPSPLIDPLHGSSQ